MKFLTNIYDNVAAYFLKQYKDYESKPHSFHGLSAPRHCINLVCVNAAEKIYKSINPIELPMKSYEGWASTPWEHLWSACRAIRS